MPEERSSLEQRRLRTSYVISVVSIALVLFMLSVMGLLLINSQKLSRHIKENIGFNVILKDKIKNADIIWLQKELDATRYVKSTKYISKEEAAKDLISELGEDFVGFLGYNPLPSSIDVHLHAEYANPDSVAVIKKEVLKFQQVKEIFYQESLVDLVNKNVRTISFIILIISLFMLIISTALINNTIRLSIYSKRFSIRTMQLVGATESFIRKPFMKSSVKQGFIGALSALAVLYISFYIIQNQFEGVIFFEGIGLLSVIILVLGVLITGTSTYFAVHKYLRLKPDDLYY